MTCYLREINKSFLRYHTLRKSTLNCGVLTRDIILTWFALFRETWSASTLRYLDLDFLVGTARKLAKYK